MAHSIKRLRHINSIKQKLFEAVSSINGLCGWWTTQTASSSAVGGTIQFRFGEMECPQMKVVEIITNQKVKWECVSSPHGWVGHTFTFALDDNDGKTRVRFSHGGWPEQDDFYSVCCFSWGRYMESPGSFVKPKKERRLEVRDTESKKVTVT